MSNPILFSISDNRENFVDKLKTVCDSFSVNTVLYKTHFGSVNMQKFSDGELCVDFSESVRGKKIYILSSFNNSDEIVKLMLAIDAAKRANAVEIIPILPYYIYARGDKKDQSRGPIGAKVMAKMIESAGATSVILFDLHADQIQGFFDIPVMHIDGKNVFDNYIVSVCNGNTILCSPDAGSGKRVQRYKKHLAKHFGVNLSYVMAEKIRSGPNEVEEIIIIGDVTGKDVIIIDDLIDTAGTLCTAAKSLLDKGAKSVRAVISHPILSGPAYERISNSSLTELVVSDSLESKPNEKIKVISVADQISRAITAFNSGLR